MKNHRFHFSVAVPLSIPPSCNVARWKRRASSHDHVHIYTYIYIYTHIYVRSFRTYESITIKIYVRFCRRYLRCIRVTRIHVPISIFYRFHRFTPSIVANRKSNAKFFNLRLDTRDRVSRVESTRPINSVLILVVRTFIIVRQQIRNSSLVDSFVRSITFESNIASFDSNH